jgi:predicted metallopeptidase
MKKILKLFIVIVLIAIIYFLTKNSNKETYFKPVALTTTNNIVNITNKPFMDTILSVGLDVLDIKNCYITIRLMGDDIRNRFYNENGLNLQAAVVGSYDTYDVFIDNISKDQTITILSHELIHLKQYNSGDLNVIGNGVVLWKGKEIKVLDIPYEQRPWEKEAFDNQGVIANKINKILY